MTIPTPDPIALAEEAEKAICNRVRGKDRDYGPLTNREYQDILALASALRAAHEELDTIRAVVGATQNETTLHAVREMDEIMEHYIGKARELFEENTRLREALGDLIDAVEDKGLSCCGCGCCCNGSKHKAMRAARDAADAALAGGKGEG